MKYYLGVDIGGTNTKAALFDRDGKTCGVCSASTHVIPENPGYSELDMQEMWELTCRVIKEVLEKCAVQNSDISGIGICGHGKGLYLWGKDNKPARNGIVSTDSRAYKYPVAWKNDGVSEKVYEITYQQILPCQPVSLLAWIRDNEPSVYNNIKYIFECKDYIRFRLTGDAKAEYTDYSGANLINMTTRDYDGRLLELFGISEIRDALPQLCRSTDVAGYVNDEAAEMCGLQAGTPVIGGMFDIDACAIGTGVVDEEHVCMIAGTWSINEYIRKTPVTDGSVMMNSLFALPEYFLIEECSPTSAGNNEWFLREVLNGKSEGYDEINKWVEEISPYTFVPVFLPFVLASNVNPLAKGSFVGLTANHSVKHLVRSVYEGIAFSHRMHMERLLLSRDAETKSVRLAGGAAHSAVWSQMFADVLQMPVETVESEETGALGCAIAVAYAVGDYDSIENAASHMCKVLKVYYPDKAKAEIYDKKYHLYKKTIDCLDGVWEDMQCLIENK